MVLKEEYDEAQESIGNWTFAAATSSAVGAFFAALVHAGSTPALVPSIVCFLSAAVCYVGRSRCARDIMGYRDDRRVEIAQRDVGMM